MMSIKLNRKNYFPAHVTIKVNDAGIQPVQNKRSKGKQWRL